MSSMKEDHKSPMETANPLSALTFYWANALVKLGYRQALREEDLWKLPEEEESTHASQRLMQALPYHSAMVASWVAFRSRILVTGLITICWMLFALATPAVFLKRLISWAESADTDDPDTYSDGWIWMSGFCICTLGRSVSMHQLFYHATRAGLRARSALAQVAYQKTLRSKNPSQCMGLAVNLMTTDAQRVFESTMYIHFIWASPLTSIAVFVFLGLEVGYAAIAGLVVLFAFFPIQMALARKTAQIRRETTAITDKRVSLISEIVTAIRLVKYYAWESHFSTQVDTLRVQELHSLRKALFLRAVNVGMVWTVPLLSSLATFFVYTKLQNEPLTATKAFTSLALFNTLRFPLVMLPMSIRAFVDARVAYQRLEQLLDEPNAEPIASLHGNEDMEGLAVVLEHATFQWEGTSEPQLEDINISVPTGSLFGVVGPVSSGKSTLLSALLGQVQATDDARVSLQGRVAYVAQEPWIFNATLQDNILFGAPLDADRYRETIHACCLEEDLVLLPQGDQTEIGERGINLSGGQKARVSLARAVYADLDIYLLDDPLSAVDAHIGKELVIRCIRGILADKTILLVTHQLQHLPHCDTIMVLFGGRMSALGGFQELQEQGVDYISQLEHVDSSTSSSEEETLVHFVAEEDPASEDESVDSEEDIASPLIQKEHMEEGNMSLKVLLYYIKAIGPSFFAGIIVVLFVSNFFRLSCDIWLSFWSTDKFSMSDYRYIYVFLGLSIISAIFITGQGMYFFSGSLHASKSLHGRIFRSLLHAPTVFYDQTPTGRLLNLLSKDTDYADDLLPELFQTLLFYGITVFVSMVLISVVFPLLLICFLPVALFYAFVWRYYRPTARELKRVENVTRAPVLSHLTATIQGIVTIRSYGAENRFLEESAQRIDQNQRAFAWFFLTARWLGFRVDMLSVSIVSMTALCAVLFRDQVDPGSLGLALVYASSLTGLFQYVVRLVSEVESYFTSIERMKSHIETCPSEAPFLCPDTEPPASWPSQGTVEFRNVSLRYRPELDPVLHHVSFEAKGGEKLGICGKTGSGKSTLLNALFRTVEVFEGSIWIDGIDIATVGLETLRSRLGIIPQDPVLFSGTIRSNVDPFGLYDDARVWEALHRAHLVPFLTTSDMDHMSEDELREAVLSLPVVDNGENYSLGQRQLFCIARTLLRNAKIIVLDEATASVDPDTDALIQQTLQTQFEDTTMITIAHRLDTIVDGSTHILVMHDGRVLEHDTPFQLLSQRQSTLSMLVRETGPEMERHLRNIVKKRQEESS